MPTYAYAQIVLRDKQPSNWNRKEPEEKHISCTLQKELV